MNSKDKVRKVPPLRIDSTYVEINSPPIMPKTTLGSVAKKGLNKNEEDLSVRSHDNSID